MPNVVPKRQWLISRPEAGAPDTETLSIGAFRVVLGESMPCVMVLDANGKRIGCILGQPIDINRQVYLDTSVTLPWPADALTLAHVEHWLRTLGGAFNALIVTPEFQRIYPSATQSFVFDAKATRAASTPLALLGAEQYESRLDRRLIAGMEIEQLGWLPAGLTAHTGVKRLLPNHALDLNTWTTIRTWSGPSSDAGSDPAPLIADVSQIMQSTMAAVAGRYQVQLAFTAGRDSRAVLAACKHIQDKLALFTIGINTAGPDLETPKDIGREFSIPHSLIPQRISTEIECQRWLKLSGHVVGGSNLKFHQSIGAFGADDAIVTGAGGEVGRGFYWNDGDTPQTLLSAERLLARMDLKPLPPVVEAMRAWLQGLEGHDTLRILDLAYIELRMGCWSSPQAHGFPEAPYHIAPLDHRGIFEALLSLPFEWRRESLYINALIASVWPALAQWPFNRFDGLRHLKYLAGKMMSYDRIRRKLRRHVIDKLRTPTDLSI